MTCGDLQRLATHGVTRGLRPATACVAQRRHPTPHKNGREDRSSRPFHVNYQQFCGLDVEAEVHNVAVLDHVLLALDA